MDLLSHREPVEMSAYIREHQWVSRCEQCAWEAYWEDKAQAATAAHAHNGDHHNAAAIIDRSTAAIPQPHSR
jgi:hypothetical protein